MQVTTTTFYASNNDNFFMHVTATAFFASNNDNSFTVHPPPRSVVFYPLQGVAYLFLENVLDFVSTSEKSVCFHKQYLSIKKI